MRRYLLLLLGALLISTQTGCVYWRLHQFRNQLSSFPDNFRIEERIQPTLVALNPILIQDDLGWLTGLPACEIVTEDGNAVEWYRGIKQYDTASDEESGAFDMVVPFRFNAAGRLFEIVAPKRFDVILTEENFDIVFATMKDGSIERISHSTDWVWPADLINVPTRTDMEVFFGVPTRQEHDEAGRVVYHYGFLLEGYSGKRWNPTEWDIALRIAFDPETDQIQESLSYIGRLSIEVRLQADRNTVRIKRL